jgi:hypothetical protein
MVIVGTATMLGNFRGRYVCAAQEQPFPYRVWPSEPPAGCPFQKSTDLTGIAFTGRHIRYQNADTWYPSWAANGNLYSPWTDGTVNGIRSFSSGKPPTTGYATLVGDDPEHLEITDAGVYTGDPAPYWGRYPSGCLVYKGVWYCGTYCLLPFRRDSDKSTLGPFVGFRYSTDYGKTWTDTPHTPTHPLFAEPAAWGGSVKIGSPHFVDFGKEMQYSPDGKAYLVGHGAVDPDPNPRPVNTSWISGDQVYMVRVKPGIHSLNDRSKYEFFGGLNPSGRPVWTRDFAKIKPLVDWNNNCGCVTMTYDAPLKKFLMCITDGGNSILKYNSYILESDHITGPWKLVVYMRDFGEQGYFVNIPSKFISADGRTVWLCYSANWTGPPKYIHYADNPPGGGYGLTLQEIKLLP